MLTRCVNCSFYIQKDIKFCPNCGLKDPAADLPDHIHLSRFITHTSQTHISKILFGILLAFIFLFVLADFAISDIFFLRDYILAMAFFAGMLLSYFLSPLIKKIYLHNMESRIIKTKNNLIEKEKVITTRIAELKSREENIETILRRIGKDASPKLLETKEQLLSARQLIMSQFLRYELQKKKIELVRMQNSVSPFLYQNHHLTFEEVEQGLQSLDLYKDKLWRFRQEYTRHDAYDFPDKIKPLKEQFLLQISETDASFEKLRESLLAKQATFAFRDLKPARENLSGSVDTAELIRESEVFNIQISITDFSDSFEELEREYQRLKAEDEISRNLLND